MLGIPQIKNEREALRFSFTAQVQAVHHALLWLSWSARQPNKLKVRGSSPRGSNAACDGPHFAFGSARRVRQFIGRSPRPGIEPGSSA